MPAYHRPTELTEALDILAAGPVCVAAGCTDLYPLTEARSLAGPVLDITNIASMPGTNSINISMFFLRCVK